MVSLFDGQKQSLCGESMMDIADTLNVWVKARKAMGMVGTSPVNPTGGWGCQPQRVACAFLKVALLRSNFEKWQPSLPIFLKDSPLSTTI
jgi:hypothetical protein